MVLLQMDNETIKEVMRIIQFPESRKNLNERIEGLIKRWQREDNEKRKIYNELEGMFEK